MIDAAVVKVSIMTSYCLLELWRSLLVVIGRKSRYVPLLVQSLERLGCWGDMGDDLAEALVSSSGMGRDVNSLLGMFLLIILVTSHCLPACLTSACCDGEEVMICSPAMKVLIDHFGDVPLSDRWNCEGLRLLWWGGSHDLFPSCEGSYRSFWWRPIVWLLEVVHWLWCESLK